MLISALRKINRSESLNCINLISMESFTIPFQLATDYINQTNRAVFLTGKAGTGKTTFLRQIKQHTNKQAVVVAPTGVAAINAGGSTIHSFFQLPFDPFVPEKQKNILANVTAGKNELIAKAKVTANRRKIMQELELLIIDEISMVRCDTLDAIDVMLRYFRFRPNEPFGGVQLLLIGDMFQLSPVVVDQEWQVLSQYYQSPYFFHSRVMLQQPPIYIELDKIYRQKNEKFIQVLNEVRSNSLSPEGFDLLKERYKPDYTPAKQDNYITLSTHNYIADKINARELALIPGESSFSKAVVQGDYPEKNYPLDAKLELKIGARVMFIKNDPGKDKRYYNGKIGEIIKIDQEYIQVKCPNDPDPILATVYTWENIKYDVDSKTQQINEKVTGTFQQFPLRLAWAITIHKSQGLTFDKAIIDAGKAFAPGQVYVALSRCTSLEGLVLMSPINAGSLFNSSHITSHCNSKPEVAEVESILAKEKIEFQKQLLNQLFDFTNSIAQTEAIYKFVSNANGSFNDDILVFLSKIIKQLSDLQVIAKKFQNQLQSLHEDGESFNSDHQIRINAGSTYFSEKITELLDEINKLNVETDSKTQAQTFNDDFKNLFSTLAQKRHITIGIMSTFSVEHYFNARKSFLVPSFKVDAYSGKNDITIKHFDTSHPKLLQRLRVLRNQICQEKNLPVYLVASSATLEELTNYLPLTLNDLAKISGFGNAKIQTYGQLFLNVVEEFCIEMNLKTLIHTKPAAKSRKKKNIQEVVLKTDTKLASYELYQSGKTIDEIARVRNFTPGTIRGHLAHYVISGDIEISQLINLDKVRLIEAALTDYHANTSVPLKQLLGDEISYGEIKLVSDIYYSRHKKVS